jgi:hypothetical protein
MTLRISPAAVAATLAAATLVSAASEAAYAQEPPLATTPPSTWRFGVNGNAVWYDNARYVTSAAWSTSGTASLDYNRRLREGSFGIGAYGGTIYYPEIEGINQATYGANLRLGTASRRTSFSLTQNFARTNTRQFDYVTEDVPLPTTGVYIATSALGIGRRLAQEWELGLSGSFSMRRYDGDSFVDGEQVNAGVQLAHLIGRSGGVYLSYQFGNEWYSETQSRAHQALLGARHRPAKGVNFEIAGGVAYVEPAEKVYPAGMASLSARGRRSSIVLQYRRDFGQAFGYGRQMVGDLASGTVSWSPWERFSLSAVYSYGYRRDTFDEDYRIRSQVASGGFGWGITKDLSFSARYSWEHNETEGYPTIEGGRAMAAISYGVEWR